MHGLRYMVRMSARTFRFPAREGPAPLFQDTSCKMRTPIHLPSYWPDLVTWLCLLQGSLRNASWLCAQLEIAGALSLREMREMVGITSHLSSISYMRPPLYFPAPVTSVIISVICSLWDTPSPLNISSERAET